MNIEKVNHYIVNELLHPTCDLQSASSEIQFSEARGETNPKRKSKTVALQLSIHPSKVFK